MNETIRARIKSTMRPGKSYSAPKLWRLLGGKDAEHSVRCVAWQMAASGEIKRIGRATFRLHDKPAIQAPTRKKPVRVFRRRERAEINAAPWPETPMQIPAGWSVRGTRHRADGPAPYYYGHAH